MFKGMIAVCIISQFNVDDKATCYLMFNEGLFETRLACMMATEPKRLKAHQDFTRLNDGQAAVISQVGCKEEDEV
mgnify:CR=1 FL=1|tara:strand:+ start:33 stop:257 length:225 start_codon:yes stop_codon:yes gene_type:complete